VRRLFLSVATLLAFAAPAQADLLPGVCGEGTTSKPYLPWADPMSYVLAPDGGLEQGGAGWSLSRGASVADGNERFHVRGAGDSRSLALPAGASATTPPICAGLDRPTLRFFARRTSGLLPLLKIEVISSSGINVLVALPAAGEWQPTLPLPIVAGVVGDSMRFRFTALGGGFRVDDVYVDPYGRY
jgi:hypothetical protein